MARPIETRRRSLGKMDVNAMSPRRATVLEILARNGHATVQELAETCGVSVVTMRQDLGALEDEGFLRRTHGGAALLETENISHRMSIRYEEKSRLAKRAAKLVQDNETVLIESGSANALLARELASRKVQIVAANLFIARQIRSGDPARVVVIGGMYQPESESVVGAMARNDIETTFFTTAFLGMDGFTPETGFTNRDMMRAEIASFVVARCRNCYILADSSKFGATGMARICGPGDLAGVITNRDLPERFAKAIKKSGAKLYLA
jgi:DeoR/GlpR family transcriptional regulator of sugar metabolism